MKVSSPRRKERQHDPFAEVVLGGTRVGGELAMGGSTFTGRLDMNGLQVAADHQMDGAQFAELDLRSARVGDRL